MRGCWVSASGSTFIYIRDSFFFAILYHNRAHMQEVLYTRRMVTTSKDRKKHKELPCSPNTPTLSFLDTYCPLSKGYQDLHSLLCQENLASCGAPCVCSTWVEPCDVTLLERFPPFVQDWFVASFIAQWWDCTRVSLFIQLWKPFWTVYRFVDIITKTPLC